MRLLPLLCLLACEGDSRPPATNGLPTPQPASPEARTSELCDDIVGLEALAWDVYAGLPVTDTILPPPVPNGPVFSHPDLPLLGFTHPTGWTPAVIRGPSTVGVNLLRDDGQALYRYVSTVATQPVTAAQLVDAEVLSVRQNLGLDGAGAVVCGLQRTGEVSPGTGIVSEVDHALVRIEGLSILVAAQVVTVDPSLPPSLFVRKLFAPTDEWPDRLYDTFLAIDWQLLVGSGADEDDRDGDGVWDVFDRFPDDPNRS